MDVSSSWIWSLGPKNLELFVELKIFKLIVHFGFLTKVEKEGLFC